ncbi:MAG: AMP-binding protein [Prolixibacteraceae bacterium]|jgi:long-chain acyl-CoA synthetase|nr:AMP-binding protein [Prolixibacteraceae bacterium]
MNNLGELLKASVETHKNKPALGFVNEPFLTYNSLWEKVLSITSFLKEKGIQKGDKVGLLSANQPNWGAAYFGIVSMGAIVVPILPDFHEDEIENILQHSEAKALFVSENLYGRITPSLYEQLTCLVIVDSFAEVKHGLNINEIKNLACTITKRSEEVAFNEIAKDDIASIIYTSGTTGKSKGVMLSHWNLVSNVFGCSKIHKTDSTDRFLSLLPLSHTYENTVAFLLPIYSGASVSYLRKLPTPAVLLPALKVVKPTMILSVPLIIEKIYKGKVLPNINGKAITRVLYKFGPTRKLLNKVAGKKLMETFGGEVKFFGIGGAKLDPSVEQFLVESKFPNAIGYGLTETAPLIAGFDSHQGKYQSTGPSVEGVTLKINDPDPITGEGEIWAKGDNVMKGYFKEPELTAEVLTEDGWFKTGDLGRFDTSGYLFIKGRLKNMIIGASGENIYPEEIEAIINRFKHVSESVVVQQKGKLVAMVHFNREELETKFKYLKEQATQYIDKNIEELKVELQEFVNSKVNKFSRVQKVVNKKEPFEKTATKKIKRFLYFKK